LQHHSTRQRSKFTRQHFNYHTLCSKVIHPQLYNITKTIPWQHRLKSWHAAILCIFSNLSKHQIQTSYICTNFRRMITYIITFCALN
jgi:hypothetical protein